MGPRDSGAATSPATNGSGLLEKLLAAVRPQFRVDVYVPDPQDRVLGTNLCAVPGCDRSAKRLCSSHDRRWRSRGCPDMAEFFADPGPPLHGRTEPGGCTVHGCHYGTSGWGLCLRHRGAWTSAGSPTPEPGRSGCPRSNGIAPLPAAFLHPVDRERQSDLLQFPRHSVAAAGLPRGRRVHRPLRAARTGPYRLRETGRPAQARGAVRRPVPPRRADDYHSASRRDLGDPTGQRRRRVLATGSLGGSVAAADRTATPLLRGVAHLRPRRRRDVARRHRVGGRVRPRHLAAAHAHQPDARRGQGTPSAEQPAL